MEVEPLGNINAELLAQQLMSGLPVLLCLGGGGGGGEGNK